MFENIVNSDLLAGNRAMLVVLVLVGIYAAFVALRLLKSGKSDHERDIERILTSDQHKVKGRFE